MTGALMMLMVSVEERGEFHYSGSEGSDYELMVTYDEGLDCDCENVMI